MERYLIPPTSKDANTGLSLIANFRVETVKRYYTGDIREVALPIVELLMDGVSDIPVRHRISCLRMQYSSK